MYCLLDERESGNERLFTDTMLAIFYQFDKFEKRYKPKGEIITVVKPYDLRYDARTSNNCVPPNLRQNPSKLQDSEGFFF